MAQARMSIVKKVGRKLRQGFALAAPAPKRTLPRVYGVGAAKTGTHSVGEMFADRVPSAHEADCEALIERVLARDASDETDLEQYLRERDRERGLKIDASQVNIYLLDELETLFPDSRYVLTVRPARAWLRSMIDDSLRRTTSETWMRFRDYRFGAHASHPQEKPLAERGLYALDGYLGYWSDAIDRVLDRIGPERLMIVRTETLGEKAHLIAAFCGLEPGIVAADRAHAFSNPTRFGVLEEIDADYLEERLAACCARARGRVLERTDGAVDLDAAAAP